MTLKMLTEAKYTCPRCDKPFSFRLYLNDSGEIVSNSSGKCEHCGYDYTVEAFLKDNPSASDNWMDNFMNSPLIIKDVPIIKKPTLYTIPDSIYLKTLKPHIHSKFAEFLISLFGEEDYLQLAEEYKLGVTNERDVIFYQIDKENRCRSGKIMKYDPISGHRIKIEGGKITWVHSVLKEKNILENNWKLSQCLFGEHLLDKYPDKPVALVESEKTAVICSKAFPKFLWLACGGKTQLDSRINVLEDRKVVLFPDIDGYQQWEKKAKGFSNISVSSYLKDIATSEQKLANIDIADIVINKIFSKKESSKPIKKYNIINIDNMFNDNKEIKELIKNLDLQCYMIHS